jgi:hypothetical protein
VSPSQLGVARVVCTVTVHPNPVSIWTLSGLLSRELHALPLDGWAPCGRALRRVMVETKGMVAEMYQPSHRPAQPRPSETPVPAITH